MTGNTNETILNGRYRLVSQQGSGGMAVIYRAVDLLLGRTVAVKILRPSLIANETFLQRFRDEARSIAKLPVHPNIVTVHDVGNDGPTHYIVMEYVEGQDLKKIIRTEGVLTVKRSIDLGIQICDGIGFAHRSNLVHADVKPQNILVTTDDRVKVTDFGIARVLTDTQPLQRQDVVWGSPQYFAPEQARGEKPIPASDVYAIGIVMFEMLTGRLPYTGSSQQEFALAHLREQVPLVSEFNPSVPENLAKIIYKVMSKEPSMRYSQADQLGNLLKSYRDRSQQHTTFNVSAGNAPSIPQPPSIPAPPPRPGLRPSGESEISRPVPAQPVEPPRPATGASQRIPPSPPPQSGQSRTIPAATRSAQPAPPPVSSSGFQPIGPRLPEPPASDRVSGDSQFSRSQPVRSQSQSYVPRSAPSAGIDLVTIVLAFIALIAVGGLFPLYIWVLQAYAGG